MEYLGYESEAARLDIDDRLDRDRDGVINLDIREASARHVADARRYAAVKLWQNSSGDLAKVQLPVCPQARIVAPEVVLRSSLFGLNAHRTVHTKVGGKTVTKVERVVYVEDGKICARPGEAQLVYYGSALDQADFDVWLQLLDIAKDDLTKPFSVRLGVLLASLGRGDGGEDYKALVRSLKRLSLGQFSLERSGGPRSTGAKFIIQGTKLIDSADVDERVGLVTVTLHETIAEFFSTRALVGWSSLHKEQRRQLNGNPLAQWLHAFYSSHAKPIPLSLERLQKHCGSTVLKAEFKRALLGSPASEGGRVRRGALQALVEVGFLQKGFRIDAKTDLVRVTRARAGVSKSQAKSLATA